jgi:hypothetical protein
MVLGKKGGERGCEGRGVDGLKASGDGGEIEDLGITIHLSYTTSNRRMVSTSEGGKGYLV